jgi:predicted dehydrogenase
VENGRVRVAILGCGNIAGPYARDLVKASQVELVGMADLETARAEAMAQEYGVRAYSSPAELLADESVDLIVNLTIHHAHYEVTKACLEAGKHVHSEKPLALTTAEAEDLVRLASEKGLRLGCSPFTWMGEAQQTAWKLIREGSLGAVRVAYAEVNWGRIESWHPNPGPFYQVGALFDVGVYPLTMMTTVFGPARKVWSYGTLLHPDRVTKDGVPFQIATPDFVVTLLEFDGGTVARLTTDFYVSNRSTKQTGIEFHGDLGSLHLTSWQLFNASVEFAKFNEGFEPVPMVKDAFQGTEWGRGVMDMADAILNNRPHRATGAQAAHVVEILNAAAASMQSGQMVDLHTTFEAPAPMEWAV